MATETIEQQQLWREARANLYAASMLGLSPRDTMLRGKQAAKFRTLYTEEYMRTPIAVEVEVGCTCSYRPYPHHHSLEDRARARRIFESQCKSGSVRK